MIIDTLLVLVESVEIIVPGFVRSLVEFQAAEAFPLEVAGVVIGDHSVITTVGIITKYEVRTRETLEYEHENIEHVADEILGESVGFFHSHPGWPETISRPGDYTNRVSKGCSDLENMEEDAIEWIVSIWPGKRKFRFRHRVYIRVGNVPRIMRINWG